MRIKRFKLFEGVEDDLIFSLSEDDIMDMFLPLTDVGSVVQIESKFYSDGQNNIERNDRNFTSMVNQESLYGVYRLSVKLCKKSDDLEETTFYSNGVDITKYYKAFIDTLLQVSKRVENIEWEPEMYLSTVLKVMIICKKKKYDTIIKKDIVRKSYKNSFNEILHRNAKKVLSKVCDLCTEAFCKKGIGMPFLINSEHDKTMSSGVFYLYFADMPKATVTINRRKTGRVIEDVDTFRARNIPNIEIQPRAKYVMIVEFDYDEIVRDSKLDVKYLFN
jgi:hypothetical protein